MGGVLKQCAQVPECQNLIHGMNGKEVQDCINKCGFEYGEKLLEQWACRYASDVYAGGVADFFCNNVLSTIMEPVNNFLNKYIETPVVHAAERVENAVASAGRSISNFFHFSAWSEQQNKSKASVVV